MTKLEQVFLRLSIKGQGIEPDELIGRDTSPGKLDSLDVAVAVGLVRQRTD